MNKVVRSLLVLVTVIVVFSMFGTVNATMMGPGWPGMGGPGMFGNAMMTNNGGFGMMNGMTGAPIIGDDGTAYLVSYSPTANPGIAPNSNSFKSTILAYGPNGQVSSLDLKGIVSRPIILGDYMVATASLPDFSNYSFFGNYGTNPVSGQSVLYVVNAPLTSSTTPLAISMDGSFASAPVIANNHVYVTTSDWGTAMMNNMANWMYGNYNFNQAGNAKTYLYIFNLDGTLASKIVVQ